MKLISWNVNGVRAAAKKGLAAFLRSEKAAVFCLQEIKMSAAARAAVELDLADYQEYWHPAERPGYSGTAILVKKDCPGFLGVKNGFGQEEFDREGRVQTAEFTDFYLLNVYFPNSNHELSRLGYKLRFNEALLRYAKKLLKRKSVIITGDYNVAHEEIDLARPKENVGNPGFTVEERSWFSKFLAVGFIDSFRQLNGKTVKYSWWSYRAGARRRNIGWRIDYFCVSKELGKCLKKADILDNISGSDHAPVVLEIKP